MRKFYSLIVVFICLYGNYGFCVDSLAIKYSKTILKDDLSIHLHILASDSFQGRETGEIGQKMAAKYISNSFASNNIPPLHNNTDSATYFQKFQIELCSPSGAKIINKSKTYNFIDDFYYFSGFSDINLEQKDILFLGYGIESDTYNDYKDNDVKGKILLVLNGEPRNKKGRSLITGTNTQSVWTTNRKKKIQTATNNGAAAILVILENYNNNINQIAHYVKKPSYKLILDNEEENKNIPVFYISPEMARDLLSEQGDKWPFKRIKKKTYKQKSPQIKLITTPLNIVVERDKKEITTENILGYIEGTDKKEELLVITAHYDHLGVIDGETYNGADDDGSGTVALLEMAEAFSKAKSDGHGPRRSILFMPFVGEEKGLLGSKYYVNKPIFPLNNTIANLNIDMIGRIDDKHIDNSNYVYLIGADKLSSDLHNISSKCNKEYTGLELDYTYNDLNDPNRFYYRSDHYNFATNNIPVIFFFTGIHEDYHKATDTVDKINFDKIEKITKLVFFTAWTLANREDRILVDKEQNNEE